MLEKVQQNQTLILNASALVFAFVIGFMSLKSLRASTKLAEQPALSASAQMHLPSIERFDSSALHSGESGVEDPSRAVKMLPELAALQANQETKQRVATTVEKQPEIATKMMKAWLKEA